MRSSGFGKFFIREVEEKCGGTLVEEIKENIKQCQIISKNIFHYWFEFSNGAVCTN